MPRPPAAAHPDPPPVTVAELADKLHRTDEQLGNLLDLLITMPASLLPDERHNLLADAAGLRRDVRIARARLVDQ